MFGSLAGNTISFNDILTLFQNWISSQCKKIANGKNYHVGATDQGTEGKWRNVDNSKFPTDKRLLSISHLFQLSELLMYIRNVCTKFSLY